MLVHLYHRPAVVFIDGDALFKTLFFVELDSAVVVFKNFEQNRLSWFSDTAGRLEQRPAYTFALMAFAHK